MVQMIKESSSKEAEIMSAVRATTASDTRKTFDVRPSQTPVNYEKLIATAMKRFPKVHAVLAK